MYVLQMSIDTDSSVVLGVYDTIGNLWAATDEYQKLNPEFANKEFFYDVKKMNADAEWTNEQSAIRIGK